MFKALILTLALGTLTTATLQEATSNTKGKCPASVNCSGILQQATSNLHVRQANKSSNQGINSHSSSGMLA